jgi:peptidoglycan/LPS O-acetylase OafA/YrhL
MLYPCTSAHCTRLYCERSKSARVPTGDCLVTSSPPEPDGRNRERLPFLDLMRFMAASMVVFFHYTFRGAADSTFLNVTYPALDGLTRYGSFGVNLFFVISGFVILLTVDAGRGRPGHFIASRISRLYPAFWAAVTLTYTICVVTGASFAVSLKDYVLNLGMFPSWLRAAYVDGAYWTLETELTFYLLVVAYLLFLQRRVRIEWLLLAWLIIILPFAPNDWGPGRLRLLIMTDSAPFFIAGCLYYRIWRDGWTRLRVGILLAAWLAACVIAARGASDASASFGTPFSAPISVAVASIGFVVFTALCLRPAWFRIGGRRATLLGALTYPLYLVHQNIGYVVINATAPAWGSWVALVLAVATAVGLAYTIHRLVERRYNTRFRRWLEPRLGGFDRIADVVAMRINLHLRPRRQP